MKVLMRALTPSSRRIDAAGAAAVAFFHGAQAGF